MILPTALEHLIRDGWLLIATRFVPGCLPTAPCSVVLVFHLIGIGLSEPQTREGMGLERADGRWTVDAWAPLDGRVINEGVRLAF